MAVKSSTKKRLIELGVSEEHAHKLADDANMDAIKRMTVEEVAKKVGLESGASELENIMGIIREQAASRRRSRSGRVTISRTALLDEDIPLGEDRFNVLNHQLVPHHSLIAEEYDLPAGWLRNRVVKIFRYSRSAGASTAYRLIVESN